MNSLTINKSNPLILIVLVGMISLNLVYHILPELWHSSHEYSALLIALAFCAGLAFQHYLHQKLHHQTGHGFLVSLHLHNLSDGLVIGMAFLSSTLIGLSASLAVGLHDLVHKVIGFNLLRNQGDQVKAAALKIFSTLLTIVLGAWLTIKLQPSEHLGAFLQGFAAGSLAYIVWLLVKRVLAMTEKQSLKFLFFLAGSLLMFCLTFLLHQFAPDLDH